MDHHISRCKLEPEAKDLHVVPIMHAPNFLESTSYGNPLFKYFDQPIGTLSHRIVNRQMSDPVSRLSSCAIN